jgi:hypothetical protein
LGVCDLQGIFIEALKGEECIQSEYFGFPFFSSDLDNAIDIFIAILFRVIKLYIASSEFGSVEEIAHLY